MNKNYEKELVVIYYQKILQEISFLQTNQKQTCMITF